MGCGERLGKVFHQVAEGPGQGHGPGNQNIIGTLKPLLRQYGRRDGPQAALGAVALDGATDFP